MVLSFGVVQNTGVTPRPTFPDSDIQFLRLNITHLQGLPCPRPHCKLLRVLREPNCAHPTFSNGSATCLPVSKLHIRSVPSDDPLAGCLLSREISMHISICCEWLSNVFARLQVPITRSANHLLAVREVVNGYTAKVLHSFAIVRKIIDRRLVALQRRGLNQFASCCRWCRSGRNGHLL
jgi:hypothetical protein